MLLKTPGPEFSFLLIFELFKQIYTSIIFELLFDTLVLVVQRTLGTQIKAPDQFYELAFSQKKNKKDT